MELATDILVILHMLGLAGVIGGFAAVMKNPAVVPAMVHGAVTQLVTGVLLVGLHEMGDGSVNHAKVGVKLVIALAVMVAVFVGARADNAKKSAVMAKSAALLAVVNVAVAVLWH